MLNLNDRKWETFCLENLFIIKGSKTTRPQIIEKMDEGRYPYVTTQTTQNGQAGYYNIQTEQGNVLVVDSAVIGFCTYQQNPFTASDHVEKLIPRFKLNRRIGLFMALVINENNKRKYSYGYKASQTRLKKNSILLPVTKDGQPDYAFMEQYIKEREDKLKQKYIHFIGNKWKYGGGNSKP